MPTCSICLDEIKCLSKTVPCCKKKFHKKCIYTWLKTNNSCPLCRKTIIENRVNYWFLKKFLNFVCLFFDRKFIILLSIFIMLTITSFIFLNQDEDDELYILGFFIFILDAIFASLLLTRFIYYIKKCRRDVMNLVFNDENEENNDNNSIILVYNLEEDS